MSVLAKSVVESVAKALSGEYGVTVTFNGNDCYTDGKRIVLPSLPDEVPNSLVEILRGYLDHEVGHVVFTDFNVVKKAMSNPAERFALNAIEDLRIECEMEKVWKGCAINFEKTESRVDAELKPEEWDKMDPIVKIFFLFMRIARRGWDHPWAVEKMGDFAPILDDLADEVDQVAELKSTADALTMAKRLLGKIKHSIEKAKEKARKDPPMEKGEEDEPSEGTDSSEDSKADPGKITEIKISGEEDAAGEAVEEAEFADEVKITIAEDKKDEGSELEKGEEDEAAEDTAFDPEKDGEESPVVSKESEDAEDVEKEGSGEESASASTSGSGSESEEEPDSEPASESGSLCGPGVGSDAGEESSSDSETGPGIELPSELIEALEESLSSDEKKKMPSSAELIIKEAGEAASGSGHWRPFTVAQDSFAPPKTRTSDDEALKQYEDIRNEIGGIVGVLKAQLLRLLLSKKRSKWVGGKRQGSINPAALPHIIQGTSDLVYRLRQEGTKINTAVSITVDLSGSMGGDGKIFMAQKTTALLAETLSLLNIPFEILGFTGDWHTSSPGERSDFTRWGSLDIIRFKTFDEPFGKEQRKRIGVMTDVHMCQNYDGESVLFAAKRLMERREKKKVQFVLSDGEPAASYCRSRALDPHLRKVTKELEAIPDYYLCGFGILTGAPARYYKNHVVVKNLAELPKTLMESLFQALVIE